jgi:hypothetical protein
MKNPLPMRHCGLAAFCAIALTAWTTGLFAEQLFPDPTGDLIGLNEDGPDATALIVRDLGDTLLIEIELADAAAATNLAGLIEIDTEVQDDSASHSGRRSRVSLLCPQPTGLGVNRTINLFPAGQTHMPVLDANDEPIGMVGARQTLRGLALAIDKSLIGLEIGMIGLAAVIGQEEASDCIPDGTGSTRALVSLHRVRIRVAAGAGGTVSGGGAAEFESQVTVTAEPEAGHVFAGWFANGALVSTQKEFTFTATTSRTLSAQFLSAFPVGGTVVGLEEDEEVTLQLNQDELLKVAENGMFQFESTLVTGTAYEVDIANQPLDPNRSCRVENGSGEVDDRAVDDIEIICRSDHEPLFGDRFEVSADY